MIIAKIIDSKLSELTVDFNSGNAAIAYDDINKEFRFLITREVAGMLNGTRSLLGYRIYSTSFFWING
ncbi:MAG: hypothetical protein IPG07_21310 [Crocinitomicaceae bacterium]|nr:hypothetical protein [Crocinitomicaceae bacterium]